MSYFPEQLASVIKSNAEAQHAITVELKDKLIKHFDEFAKLNVDAVKAAVTESSSDIKEILQANDAQELFLLSAMHMKRDIQNAVFYGVQTARIIAAAQIELNQAAMAKAAETSQNGTALLTALTKNFPVNADKLFTVMTSSMEAFEAANEFVKQMGDGAAAGASSMPGARHASRKRSDHQAADIHH